MCIHCIQSSRYTVPNPPHILYPILHVPNPLHPILHIPKPPHACTPNPQPSQSSTYPILHTGAILHIHTVPNPQPTPSSTPPHLPCTSAAGVVSKIGLQGATGMCQHLQQPLENRMLLGEPIPKGMQT